VPRVVPSDCRRRWGEAVTVAVVIVLRVDETGHGDLTGRDCATWTEALDELRTALFTLETGGTPWAAAHVLPGYTVEQYRHAEELALERGMRRP
jgi:hypothetical protein